MTTSFPGSLERKEPGNEAGKMAGSLVGNKARCEISLMTLQFQKSYFKTENSNVKREKLNAKI